MKSLCSFLYLISVLLVVGFGFRFGADCYKYGGFRLDAFGERILEFILPSLVVLIIAKLLDKRFS